MKKDILKNIEVGEDDETSLNKNTNKKTGAKISKKGIALLIAAGLITTSIAGTIGYKHLVNYINDQEAQTQAEKANGRATSIVSLYQNGDLCSIDEPIYSSKNYDTKICDGQTLVDVLNKNQIKYCEILDEYYTNDGRNIAIVTLEVEHTEKIQPEALVDEKLGVTYYTIPEGYEYIDGCYQKKTTETKVVVTEVEKNGKYNKLELPGVTIKQVISVDVVPTKSYDEIISSDFICDVKDDYAQHLNGQLSEATYRLIPKRN